MAMRTSGWAVLFFVVVLLALAPSLGHCEQPVSVTACQLASDPPRYDHVLVSVSGHVGHGFEGFTIQDDHCRDKAVWLEYGGMRGSGTIYCCGKTDEQSRSSPLIVDGTMTRLVDDEVFGQFDQMISRGGSVKIDATLVGRFFAGRLQQFGDGKLYWGSYGHMGMYSLLVIQQVTSARWVSEEPAQTDPGLPDDDVDPAPAASAGAETATPAPARP